MINISEENQQLCFADSTRKPLMLFMYYWVEDNNYDNGGYWKYLRTLESEIVLESAELEEGILDSNNFELGSYVVPTLNVKWQNNGIRYEKMLCIPVQQIGDEYIAYFNGWVNKESVSNDGKIVNATIVSNIYNELDKPFIESSYPQTYITRYVFADILVSLFQFWNIYIDEEKLKKNFVNANLPYPTFSNLTSRTTLSTILKHAGEFLGAHIRFNGKRLVDIEQLKNFIITEVKEEIEFIRIPNIDIVNSQSKLPPYFKALPYLEFDGNQYINTDVIPTDTTSAEYKYAVKENADGNVVSHILSADKCYFPHVFRENDNAYLKIYRGQSGEQIPLTFVASDYIYEIKAFLYDENSVIVNGKRYDTETSPDLSNENTPLYLGTWGGDANTIYWRFVGKVYYCKIYDNGLLIRDFIPCLNEYGIAGMYDSVNGYFYSNLGQQDFLHPNETDIFTLPYYINVIADKTNSINYGNITLTTETGDTLNYSKNIKDNINNQCQIYKITNNAFFEELGEDKRWQALEEIGSYLASLNFYNAEINSVYAPFMQSGDFLIAQNRNTPIPIGYEPLEYIVINGNYGQSIYTGVIPENEDVELIVEFEPMDGYATIFESSSFENSSRLGLYFNALRNKLQFILGYDDIEISPVLKQSKQAKITLKSKRYIYDYFSKGVGNANAENIPFNMPLILGGNNGYKLYHFEYNKIVKGSNIFDPEMYYSASNKDQVQLDNDIFTMRVPTASVFINKLNLNPIVTPKGTYTISIYPLEYYEDFNICVYLYKLDGSNLSTLFLGTDWNKYSYTFTTTENFILTIGGVYNHLYNGDRKFKVCLESGSKEQNQYIPYTENKIKLLDMYPCIDDKNYSSGVYDIVSQTFFPSGNEIPNEIGRKQIIMPVLSTTANGIHSMKSTTVCKATNK